MKKFILITMLVSTFNVFATCQDPVSCLSEIQQVNTSSIAATNCPPQDIEENEILNTSPIVAPLSNQEDKGKKRVFDKDAWKYTLFGVGLAPAAFVAGAALHEGGHCLAAEMMEFNCYNVKVIPYRDESGYLYFASMNYSVPENADHSPEQHALITVAPMITNAGLISIYSTLAFTDSLPKNKWAKTATLVLGATQVIDLVNHVQNTHMKSDSGKLIYFLKDEHGLNNKQSYWAVKGPQIGFAALGASALVLEGVRIFTKPSQKNRERNIRLTPAVGPNAVQLGISGQF